ncbi:uroporphyrinogen-III C-methyltransferase [Alkalimarinus coralli]|uniref:uroporphyrinogen-III C-methyltransferase n=1 Tax=Alkalimarinus coralli TaxID=2935863 RepID=UPI00202B78A7|nr:uroporphyrinogen-III C-methyltransferase [Alkalimarinus coralli]
MTNESQSQLVVPDTPLKPSPKVRLWPLWIIIIILIAALGGLATYGWVNVQQIEQLKFQLSHITKDDGTLKESLNRLESQIGKHRTDLLTQNRAVSDQMATLRRQTEHNAMQLAKVGGQSRTDWLLAEAEYLIRLANQRLNMERDAIGAEAILNAANSVLAESDDPGLYIIRKQLSKDILALQRVSKIDREGIYLQLEALLDLVDKLDQSHYQTQRLESFTAEAVADDNTQATKENQFSRLLDQTLSELKQLVVIRRLDEQVEPLLAPDQVYYLQQNLRLMIEQAELALLDRNQQIYLRSLAKAEKWIKTYFSQNKDDTALLLNTLNDLQAHKINPDLPDISQSLLLLKERVALLYRQHQVPSSPSASSDPQAGTDSATKQADTDGAATE